MSVRRGRRTSDCASRGRYRNRVSRAFVAYTCAEQLGGVSHVVAENCVGILHAELSSRASHGEAGDSLVLELLEVCGAKRALS